LGKVRAGLVDHQQKIQKKLTKISELNDYDILKQWPIQIDMSASL
jgi:hypothetical protein